MTPRHPTPDTLALALAGAALAASLLLGAADVAHAQASRPAITRTYPRTWRIAVPDRRQIQYSPAGRTGQRSVR